MGVLMDEMDLNFLINLGVGLDGDKGFSGMPAGFHVFIKPPPIDIIGTFINALVTTITKVLKVGNFPTPKFPTLSGVEMGFSIGEKIGFRFQIGKLFSITCFIKTVDGFGISCKLGVDFISIVLEGVKWIAKMGKKLFDLAGKAIMVVGQKIGEFATDIAEGAKIVLKEIADVAKEGLRIAKKVVKVLHEETKKVIKKIVEIHNTIKKAISKAWKALGETVKAIVDKFAKILENIGKAIVGFLYDVGEYIFAHHNYLRKKREKERKQREYKKRQAQRQKEIDAKKREYAAWEKEQRRKEREDEEKLENEKRDKIDKENDAQQDAWRKNILYQRAEKNLNDL